MKPSKASEKRDEVAEKAKRKFIENLNKFQRESAQVEAAKNSAFQRSYRTSNNKPALYRGSCRAPPVSKVDSAAAAGTRRSLRKSSTAQENRRTTPSKVSAQSSDRPPSNKKQDGVDKENDRSSTASGGRGASGTTFSRPSSSSSSSTHSDSHSSTPSSGGKRPTRAELAMERHMERMRKASSPSIISGIQAGAASSRPKGKTKSDDDVTNSSSKTPKKESQAPKESKSEALSKIDEETVQPAAPPVKSPTCNSPSIKIIEDDVFGADPGPRDKAEIVDDSVGARSAETEAPSSKSTNSTATTDSSRTSARARPSDDVDINCSVEEAMSTFRKLSEEVETLKEKDFGKRRRDEAPKPAAGRRSRKRESKQKETAKAAVRPSANSAKAAAAPAAGKARSSPETPKRKIEKQQKEAAGKGSVKETVRSPTAAEVAEAESDSPSQSIPETIKIKPVELNLKHAALKEDALKPPTPLIHEAKAPSQLIVKSPTREAPKTPRSEAPGYDFVTTESFVIDSKTLSDASSEDKAAKPAPDNAGGARTLPGSDVARGSASKAQTGAEERAGEKRARVTSPTGSAGVAAKRRGAGETEASLAEIGSSMASTESRKVRFSDLAASEKRARLRRAFLKVQKQQDSSSDDESVISDGPSSDEDYDPNWLDSEEPYASSTSFGQPRKQKTTFISTTTTAASLPKIVEAPTPVENKSVEVSTDTNKLTAIWETKIEERKASVTSQTRAEVNVNLNNVKSAFEPAREAEPEQAAPVQSNAEAGRLSSMLNMWESKKAEVKPAFDAANDEAFDVSTMGRLQGAKDLFRSMSQRSPQRVTAKPSPQKLPPKSVTSPKRHTPTAEVPKPEPVPAPKVVEPAVKPRPRKVTDSDVSDFDDEDLSDIDSLSSTSSSDEGSLDVSNVRNMWERQSVNGSHERNSSQHSDAATPQQSASMTSSIVTR